LTLCLGPNFRETLAGKDRQKENCGPVGERLIGADWKQNLMAVMLGCTKLGT